MTQQFDEINKKILSGTPDFAEAIQNHEVGLKRYSSEPPRYELVWSNIAGDTIISLDGDELWSWATVQKAIFKVWKVIVEDMKPTDWHSLLTILNGTQEEVKESGASMAAEVLDILEHWLERYGQTQWSAGELILKPLIKDSYYYFRIVAFESGALFAQNSRFYYQRHAIPRPKLYEILKRAGGKSVVKKFGKKNLRVWEIPEGFNKPPEPPEGELPVSVDEELEENTESPQSQEAQSSGTDDEPPI